jgi:hypothetical protein
LKLLRYGRRPDPNPAAGPQWNNQGRNSAGINKSYDKYGGGPPPYDRYGPPQYDQYGQPIYDQYGAPYGQPPGPETWDNRGGVYMEAPPDYPISGFDKLFYAPNMYVRPIVGVFEGLQGPTQARTYLAFPGAPSATKGNIFPLFAVQDVQNYCGKSCLR